MRASMLAVVGALVVGACSNETEGSGPSSACADISGNYSVRNERISGTCDPSLDRAEGSSSLSRDGDGWIVKAPGLSGGCPGTLDPNTCRFTSQCEILGADGAVLATLSMDFTFTASGYSGTTVSGARPPAVATACEGTFKVNAAKL